MFIVKIPGINGEKSKGCERAGDAIIRELRNISVNEQGKIVDANLLNFEEIHLDNSNLELTNNLIYGNSLETFETKPKMIFLGGDHSVSYSVLRAFLDYCKNSSKNPCLIIFDAHLDCKKQNDKFPNNEEWLHALIEHGFPSENIIVIGARNFGINELSFAKHKNVKILSIDSITEDLHEACDTIMEFSNGKELYVSIDIGVIDPAFAPSTKNPESGGLISRDFLYIIKRINKIKNLKAIDIMEINEQKDKTKENVTVKLGAKLLSELI
jgi:arginase family enzyme